MSFFEEYKILTDFQHGFRSRRSCDTQLFITTHDILSTMDTGHQVDAVVLDFSKAFDRVPHQRLLHKLDYYGIRGKVNNWIGAFLNNRTQRVVVDGSSSTSCAVRSGVPQGTVLGPVLFLTFINDITENIHSNIRLFADDCLVYRAIKGQEDNNLLQKDMDSLHRWSQTWQMEFNVDKCHTMHIGRSERNRKTFDYNLGGQVLASDVNTSYLGVRLSNNMSWKSQVDQVTTKSDRALNFIRRNLQRCPASIRSNAYVTLVRPILEYCGHIWNPYNSQQIHQIEMVQRRAARFVTNTPWTRTQDQASVTLMVNNLGWDTLEQRRNRSSLTFMYKMDNNLIDIPASYIPVHSTNRYPHRFIQVRSNTHQFSNSFIPRTIKTWNRLPEHIALAPSLDTFKVRLQTFTY